MKRHHTQTKALFAIFQITETGADELYKSRDLNGNPLRSYSKAVEMKEHLNTHVGGKNLIVRALR